MNRYSGDRQDRRNLAQVPRASAHEYHPAIGPNDCLCHRVAVIDIHRGTTRAYYCAECARALASSIEAALAIAAEAMFQRSQSIAADEE